MPPKLVLPKLELSAPRQLFFAISRIFGLLWRIDKRLSLFLLSLNIVDGLVTLPMIYTEKLILDRIVSNIGNPTWQPAIKFILLVSLARVTLQVIQDFTRRFNGVYGNLLGRKYSDKLEIILGEKYAELDLSTIEDPGFKDRYNKIDRESRGRAWTLVTTLFFIPNSLAGRVFSVVILYFF